MLLERPALRYIKPMSPRLVETAPSGDTWLHEIKFDGYRTQLHVEGGTARAFSKGGHIWSSKYPQIVAATARLRCTSAILDGEVYLPDANGAADFAGLPSAIRWHPEQLIFAAFDLLHLDGADLRSKPLTARKALLADLLRSAPAPCLAFCDEIPADGPEAFAAIDAMDLEGIVSKKRDSRYKSGDADTWRKTKTFTISELEVIGADVTPTGEPKALLARRDEHGLHYVGDAFITLKAPERQAFWNYVQGNTVEAPVLPLKQRGTWVRPGMEASVRHLRGEGMLRHGTFKGLRFVDR